jgi:broad specificity phosphatase PhoE
MVLQGRTDLPLSRRGWRQVELLRQRLRREPGFTAIYSSPLRRAGATAAALSEAGLGPLRFRPDLQEIDCGALDGLPVDEVQRRFPRLWAANLRQTDEHFRWPGGETYREFRDRCLGAVGAVASRQEGRIALVTHAGVIGQILGALAGTSPAQWESFRPGNTGLTEIEWANGRGKVLRHDDRGHLLDD